MFIAVDIGNTNIKIALFKDQKIFQQCRMLTDKKGTVKKYQELLKKVFIQKETEKIKIEAIIICSVVPKLTPIFKKAFFALFKISPLILGKDIIAPIKNLYSKPKQVGQDRLANAVAAADNYGSPVIVVDFGTAVTFDAISPKGSYLGGIIVPGIEISLQALISKTELLPKVSLSKPKRLLGRKTDSSMKSGIVYGYSFLVEGILQRLKKKLKPQPLVVATGGAAAIMKHYCRSINRIDENLTLKGLLVVLKKRKKAKIIKKR